MKPLSIAPGSYLIASPSLVDPNFRRAVVLVCEHGEEGSLGLVVNRPTPVTLDKVVAGMSGVNGDTAGPATVFCGGPVEMQRLMVVRLGDTAPAGGAVEVQPLCDGVSLVVDITKLLDAIRSEHEPVDDYRFFVGYAGWGRGQLSTEMRENAWILRHPDPNLLFHTSPRKVWEHALQELGGIYSLYSKMPHDPSSN